MKTIRSGWVGFAGLALVVALAAGGLFAGSALAQRGLPGGGQGYGQGMMGSSYGPGNGQPNGAIATPAPGYWDNGAGGYVPGMMGGYGQGYGSAMMGGYGQAYGLGMMGGYGALSNPNAPRQTGSQVQQAVTDYINRYYGGESLAIAEIMEFQNNFYAQITEQSTGINAFELLVDPYTGNVWPEYGPNMMWNTKYGMMSHGMRRGWFGRYSQPTEDMTVTSDQAVANAQQYLDARSTSLTVEDETDTFYGYYTLHTFNDGKIEGMLSVNGYTGQVWYHSWHGLFIGMVGQPGL